LLVVASGLTRAELVSLGALDPGAVRRFDALVARRRDGVPLQHLEGTVQFGPLELRSDSRALIPRPETELLWARVVEECAAEAPALIVDLCTGSGNLALALKHTYPAAEVFGTDTSVAALELAAENGEATGLEVSWRQGDLFGALPAELRGAVDVVVSNPPYIAAGDFAELPVEVRDHDPHEALVAGPVGDEVLARIAASAGQWLADGGLIACEIGADQGPQAGHLFSSFAPRIEQDLTGRDRFVFGCRAVR
jgi:release factor glutamine methyltransferase